MTLNIQLSFGTSKKLWIAFLCTPPNWYTIFIKSDLSKIIFKSNRENRIAKNLNWILLYKRPKSLILFRIKLCLHLKHFRDYLASVGKTRTSIWSSHNVTRSLKVIDTVYFDIHFNTHIQNIYLYSSLFSILYENFEGNTLSVHVVKFNEHIYFYFYLFIIGCFYLC